MATKKEQARKARDAVRDCTTTLCEIIVNANFTTIANACEEKGIITTDFKGTLTSGTTGRTEKDRAYSLLDAVKRSISEYNLNKPMNDFLCIIRDYGGLGGEGIAREIAQNCGCELQNFPKQKSPGRITTKAVQERSSDDDEEVVDTITTDFGNPVHVYPNKNRGLVLVICNEKWPDSKRDRKGCCVDIEAIQQTFKNLKYNVIIKKDMTTSEMLGYFKDLYSVFEKEFASGDCFICFIMSHGGSHGIEGTNGKFVTVEELAECVQSDKCISLKEKPKLFFVQACRGRDTPNEVKLDGPTTTEGNHIVTDGRISAIPPEADFFFGYSTVSNNAALRGTLLGSYYIQALCETIKNYKKLTLHDIMMLVHQKLATEDKYVFVEGATRYRQMGQTVSTLRGNFFFKK